MKSFGVVSLAHIFDATLACVEKSMGQKAGTLTVYMEPWHLDIVEFLELKTKGKMLSTNISGALSVPDLL